MKEILYIKDYKNITVPVRPEHYELIVFAANKSERSVRQWMRRIIEEKLALLGYIEEPED